MEEIKGYTIDGVPVVFDRILLAAEANFPRKNKMERYDEIERKEEGE